MTIQMLYYFGSATSFAGKAAELGVQTGKAAPGVEKMLFIQRGYDGMDTPLTQ